MPTHANTSLAYDNRRGYHYKRSAQIGGQQLRTYTVPVWTDPHWFTCYLSLLIYNHLHWRETKAKQHNSTVVTSRLLQTMYEYAEVATVKIVSADRYSWVICIIMLHNTDQWPKDRYIGYVDIAPCTETWQKTPENKHTRNYTVSGKKRPP